MTNTTPLVTIFGGSGFVGRYVANRMARAGWRVRVAVRRPNEAMYVKTYGTVGQVEPILANVRNEDSIKRAIAGADAVVNCVGILQENRHQKFDAVHIDAAGKVAELSWMAGIKNLVHLSAIGADADSDSEYNRSKAAGEIAVLDGFLTAAILRPSVIVGREDKFLNRLASLSMVSPIMPIVGADSKFQPVYVDDVAAAVESAIMNNAKGIFELGGPEVLSLREITQTMLDTVNRKRVIVNLPFWVASVYGWGFDMVAKMTRGLFPAALTRDQVKQLRNDSVVQDDAKVFADLGITPTNMNAVLEDYLYCYRPSGQFTAITASSRG